MDLPLVIDRTQPLSAQLTAQLRAAMSEGRVAAGERLPSSRALAAALGVSRTVVTEAFEQLYAEGWLEGRHGSGTFVADVTVVPAPARTDEPLPRECGTGIDLRPGAPGTGLLDGPAWRRAWRLAAALPPGGHRDAYGLPALREALAEHLRRSRGLACAPSRIMVTRGITNGLDLLTAALIRPGDRVGIEEPGYVRARAILTARRATIVPCPVDEHGLIVEALPTDLKLIYTTPSHQYPLGGVLPVPRRQALITWARRTGALIVEDDYDGEFRYDVAPLPALYGLDPDVVVYLGTTAKALTPDLGVGWLVARPDMLASVARKRVNLNDRTSAVPQEATRILIERGDLDRHVRRMRADYSRRRDLVVGALAGLPLRGETAGLHLVLLTPGDPEPLIREAAARGVLLDSLRRHFHGPQTAYGLVIGYSSTGLAGLRTGCELIRDMASG
ncbi:MAG: PLP-dependent aminotransferase family protein [Streptosporangiaceae bacterium]